MKYKPYPKYKDSGVKWIGEIPEDWELIKLKYISNITMGQSPNSDDCNIEGYGTPFLQGNADFSDIYPKPHYYCTLANKFSKENDILLSVRAPVGAMNISNNNYAIGRGLCAITTKKISMKYLWYLLHVIKEELSYKSKGTTYDSISLHDVGNLNCLLPKSNIQIKIVNYLDYRFNGIKDIIVKKTRLIEQLQKYRQSIITEAVTKGLDKNVLMKDSGVEWIGEIPAHWRLSKIKYESLINNKTLSESTDDDYEIDYIDISSVTSIGEIDGVQSLNFKDAPSRARRILSKGDTIVSTVRTYLKAIAFIENTQSNLICSTGFAVLTPLSKVVPKYLFYLMRSEKYVNEIVRRSVGVSYPAVNASDIGALECALPDRDEQMYIVEYLDNCTTQINQLVNDIQAQIQKLKEYRQSLISEAVTGKIDVREFVFRTGEVVANAQSAC